MPGLRVLVEALTALIAINRSPGEIGTGAAAVADQFATDVGCDPAENEVSSHPAWSVCTVQMQAVTESAPVITRFPVVAPATASVR